MALARSALTTALLLLASCSSDPTLVAVPQPPKRPPPPPPPPPPYENPIPAENQRPGEWGWDDTYDAWNHQIEGYADRVSARAGDRVRFMLASTEPRTATWRLYRLGWYDGAGARLVAEGGPVRVGPQRPCPPRPDTGLIRCRWAPTFDLVIPADAVSGLYALRATRDDGYQRFVPLVVKDDRPAAILMQANVTTWQAYNAWGGNSLYVDQSGTLPGGMAVQVSFDRPYDGDRGAGQLMRYERLMARFLERWGYDVSYVTNLDLAAGGFAALHRSRVWVTAGHDEYWPLEQREVVEEAQAAGISTLFFGANNAYWKIRLEEGGRVITCYKQAPAEDPDQGDGRTGRWRDPPIDRPENGLVGVMYESWVLNPGPWVVADDGHLLYEGTGLRTGDTLGALVGYEYDRTFANDAEPVAMRIAARTPVLDAEGKPGWSEGVTFRSPGGALVFGSGTIEWVLGLEGGPRADPRVDRMTANVLAAALGEEVPAGVGDGAIPAASEPIGPFARRVRTIATGFEGAVGVAALPAGGAAVVDARTHGVYEVGPAPAHAISRIAGDGALSNDPRYDDVPGARARFFSPTGILRVEGGYVVADTYNHCLRKIVDGPDRLTYTVAGAMGIPGLRDGVGQAARFHMPMGLAEDPLTGDILVADAYNHRIRAVRLDTWEVRTVAGGGPGDLDGPADQARFYYPTAVAAAPDGTLFVAASGTSTILRIDPEGSRMVSTIAGGMAGYADGSGLDARLAPQGGLAWSTSGLLVSEPTNFRIRRVAPGLTAASTQVSTFAGSGRFGARDGPGDEAEIPLPLGMSVGDDGTVFVVDGNGALRAIDP
ncbi:MAG TPA: N,N-dimethylformamidase beta subunit family domain-containing protein [Vulgatibacter sp.]|nr:N,N-dimethylformamidase beta subunit family domain-containing protein [Vulgatibacter sp.]